MKRPTSLALIALLVLCSPGCAGKSGDETTGAKVLQGHAEDPWGSPIELSDYCDGLTILHPFSPADCGYCLFDEEFAYANYGVNTIDRGGTFFGLCLFSPQLDIYAYCKHYRASYPIIGWPPVSPIHTIERDTSC